MADIKKYLSSEGLQAYDSSIKELIDSKFKIDQTLTQAGAAADACAVGEELENKQIQLNSVMERMYTISEDIPGEIVWDGEVGDRDEIVFAEEDGARAAFVRVSDYTPDSSILTDQGFTLGYYFYGSDEERTLSAEDAKNVVIYDDDICAWIVRAPDGGTMPFVVVKMDDRNISFEGITFYQKGIYFLNARLNASSAFYASKLSSPLMTGEGTMIKEEVIPESVVRKAELDAKQDKITGAASTITNANLSSYRALVSNGSGKVGVSIVSDYELDQLSGVQGNVQEQIDQAELMAKLALPGSLKWDGVIGDRWHLIAEESNGAAMAIVHLYDSDLLAAGVTPGNTIYGCASGVEENGIQVLSFATEVQEDGFVVEENGGIIYIPHDNYSLMGLTTFPKRGIYTLCYTLLPSGIDKSLMYMNAISIEGFSFPDQCETEAYFEKVETVVGTTSVGDTLTWDGNIDGREIVGTFEGGGFVLMSTSVPSSEELMSADAQCVLYESGNLTDSPMGWSVGHNIPNCDVYAYDGFIPIALFAHEDTYFLVEDGNNLPLKKGIYFLRGSNNSTDSLSYTKSFTLPGYNFLVEEITKETVLKNKHLPADLRHVGTAFDTFVDGNGIIKYDGEIEGRLAVKFIDTIDMLAYMVHVSDQVPDVNALMAQEGTGVIASGSEQLIGSASVIKHADGVYISTPEEFNGIPTVVITERDNIDITYNSEIFNAPKKGVYFLNAGPGAVYVKSITHPALASARVELKEEALPSSMFEIGSKPSEITWDGVSGGVLSDGFLVAYVSNYNPSKEIFISRGFSYTYNDGNAEQTYEVSAEDAINYIDEDIIIGEGNSNQGVYVIRANHLDSQTWMIMVATTTITNSNSTITKPGMYFFSLNGAYCSSISSPLITAPATQIKESALPDSIKKPADWNQDDPTQLDYIANRPFYDEWDSVIFDSSRFVGNEGIPFEFIGEVNLAIAQFSEADFAADFNRIVPNKTYTIAIGDDVYTGTSFEVSREGMTGVGIGNTSIIGELPEGMPTGDTNANLFVAYGPDGNGGNSVTLMTSKITESDNHWVAIVEGDSLKKTITEDEEYGYGTITFNGQIVSFKRNSINTFTEEDLNNGFTLICDNLNGLETTITDFSEGVAWLSTNPFSAFSSIADFKARGLSIYAKAEYDTGRYNTDVAIFTLYEDVDITTKEGYHFSFAKGTYLTTYFDVSVRGTSFTLNKSAAFAVKTPVKKIDKKYLPDQIQSSWNQNDSKQPDFIKNRPFYDGWSSVLFDSYKAIDGMPFGIPFEQQGDGILATELDLNEINLPVELDFSKVVPGKTYTIAVGDKTYTSEAFELVFQGINCVAIGNGALFGEETAMYGDPNAEFLWGYMPVMNAVAMIMFNDNRESGEYWLAMVEGDKIGNTLTKDDRGTGYLNDGLFYHQVQNISDNVITKNDLINGFEIVIAKSDGSTVTLTQDDVFIEDYFLTAAGAAEGFGIGVYERTLYDKESGVSNPIMGISPKEQMIQDDTNNRAASVSKGIYFLPAIDFTADVVSFKINNSTVFAPSTPTKQLDEKYIPDTIARVDDIKKQVQSNYLQGNSREIDFIKNRPFHDEWDSDIFKSLGLNTSAFPFEKMDGLDGVAMNPNVTSLVIYYGLFIPNKTYTFAINGNLYSGTAVGIDGDPKGFVIGNSNLVIPNSNIGDLNANFVFAYSSLNTEMPLIFYIDNITEAGEYSFSAYDAGIRDTLNWEDGERHPMELEDSSSYFNDVFFTAEDLADGFTITIQDYYNSTIRTYTQDDAIVEEKNGATTIYVNNHSRTAICCVHNNDENGFYRTDNLGTYLTYSVDVGNPKGKVTSFKPNNPLVLMPKIPAKKIDKRFLPDDIGGGTNEEEVNAIIAAPKTQFTLIDQVTGENYIVCMRDGNLVTYKAE